jgi:hypothetical protein
MDVARLVIEAKGCWNTGIPTAMRTRLVDRCLKDDSQHSLYLVGWFNCEQWDPDDRRRDASRKSTSLTLLSSHPSVAFGN